MYITDLNHEDIEVTDLKEAIRQADEFRNYILDGHPEQTRMLENYWQDIYQKLVALQNQINGTADASAV